MIVLILLGVIAVLSSFVFKFIPCKIGDKMQLCKAILESNDILWLGLVNNVNYILITIFLVVFLISWFITQTFKTTKVK